MDILFAGEEFGGSESDGRAEGVAEDYDSLGRDTRCMHYEVDSGDGVRDEALFGGVARGTTETAVVEGQDVDLFWVDTAPNPVGIRAVSLGDVAGVLESSQQSISRSIISSNIKPSISESKTHTMN